MCSGSLSMAGPAFQNPQLREAPVSPVLGMRRPRFVSSPWGRITSLGTKKEGLWEQFRTVMPCSQRSGLPRPGKTHVLGTPSL